MEHQFTKTYKNVRIRQLAPGDLESLRCWRNCSEMTQYLKRIPYITPEMQKNWYQSYLADNSEMIFAIEETEEICGIVGSMALYNFKDREAEFGKILVGHEDAHGKRVGVHAIKAMQDIAKEKLGLERLYLHVFQENIPAIKVYEKIGFTKLEQHIAYGKVEWTMTVELKEVHNA